MTELEILQKQVADLKAENSKLAEEVRATDTKALASELKARTEEAKSAFEAKSKLEIDLKARADEIVSLAASVKAGEAVAAELAVIKSEQKKLARIAQVKAALKVSEADTAAVKAAVELADSLAELSDNAFSAHVKAMTMWVTNQPQSGNTTFPHMAMTEVPKATPAPLPPKATDKPAPMRGKAGVENDPAEVVADTTVLTTAVVKPEPALATDATAAGVENIRLVIAKHLGWTPESDA